MVQSGCGSRILGTSPAQGAHDFRRLLCAGRRARPHGISRTKQCLSVQGINGLGEPGRETVRRMGTFKNACLRRHGHASERFIASNRSCCKALYYKGLRHTLGSRWDTLYTCSHPNPSPDAIRLQRQADVVAFVITPLRRTGAALRRPAHSGRPAWRGWRRSAARRRPRLGAAPPADRRRC